MRKVCPWARARARGVGEGVHRRTPVRSPTRPDSANRREPECARCGHARPQGVVMRAPPIAGARNVWLWAPCSAQGVSTRNVRSAQGVSTRKVCPCARCVHGRDLSMNTAAPPVAGMGCGWHRACAVRSLGGWGAGAVGSDVPRSVARAWPCDAPGAPSTSRRWLGLRRQRSRRISPTVCQRGRTRKLAAGQPPIGGCPHDRNPAARWRGSPPDPIRRGVRQPRDSDPLTKRRDGLDRRRGCRGHRDRHHDRHRHRRRRRSRRGRHHRRRRRSRRCGAQEAGPR